MNDYKGYTFYITAEIIGGCRAKSIEEAKDICYREIFKNLPNEHDYIVDVNGIEINIVEDSEERY